MHRVRGDRCRRRSSQPRSDTGRSGPGTVGKDLQGPRGRSRDPGSDRAPEGHSGPRGDGEGSAVRAQGGRGDRDRSQDWQGLFADGCPGRQCGRRRQEEGTQEGQGQQPPARRDQGGAGRPDPAFRRSRPARGGGGGGVRGARRWGVGDRGTGDRPGGGSGPPRPAHARQGGDRDQSGLPARCSPGCGGAPFRVSASGSPVAAGQPQSGRRTGCGGPGDRRGGAGCRRARPRLLEPSGRHLPGPQPWFGIALGGRGAGHHLRGHGRHQHGPWRTGDARRLHDLRGPAALP